MSEAAQAILVPPQAAPRAAPEPRTRPPISAGELAWRFLLPTPPVGGFRHLVLLGGTDEIARRILEQGVAGAVSRDLPDEPVADAVVRLHDAEFGLEEAGRCLRPGGVLYGEIDRSPRLGAPTPAAIRRSLERAGLAQTATYWCHPGFRDCLAYVPLEAPTAVRWYLTSASVGYSLPQKLRRLLLQVLAGWNEWGSGIVTRHYAVTAIAGAVGQGSPFVLADPRLPAAVRQAGVHLLVFCHGTRRVVLLPFSPESTHPIAALKVAKAGHSRADAEANEQRVLTSVHAEVDDSMRRTIPRPYGLIAWRDLVIGMESGVPGRMLWMSSLRRGNSRRRSLLELQSVVDWLGTFHRQTRMARVPWGGSVFQKAMESAFSAYLERFGSAAGESALFDEVLRRSSAVADTSVPVVWVHGDLHGGNVLRCGNEITVIDWAAGKKGLPLLDLVKFVTFWYTDVRHSQSRSEKIRNFRSLFVDRDPTDPAIRAIYKGIVQYMRTVDLDHRFFPILLTMRWADKAARSCDDASAELEKGSAASNLYVRYVQTLASEPARLFADLV